MGVGFGLYMYDVVVKRSRSLSHLLMSSCYIGYTCRSLPKTYDVFGSRFKTSVDWVGSEVCVGTDGVVRGSHDPVLLG